MSYTQLFYNAITFVAGSTSIVAAPHFLCPACHMAFEQTRQVAVLKNQDVNFNALVAFLCPHCGVRIDLFVAIHKTANVDDARLCIQRSDAEGAGGIPPDWWVTP